MRELFRIADRPLQRLHRTKAPAHHRGEPFDAELLCEPRLCGDPVLDGHHGKSAAPGLTRFRVDARRTCRTVTAAEVIHADHEEAPRVDGFTRADHVVP